MTGSTRNEREGWYEFQPPDSLSFSQVRGCFVLTPKVLTKAKERMIVLHPLPRIDEIRYTHTHYLLRNHWALNILER